MASIERTTALSRVRRFVLSSPGKNYNVCGLLGFGQLLRSRIARLLFSRRINYCQCICSFAVIFFVIFILQSFFLPNSESGKITNINFSRTRKNLGGVSRELAFFKELYFGEDIKFEPSRILAKFQKEHILTVGSRRLVRYGYIQPTLAMVFMDMTVDPYQIMMLTLADILREVGYRIEVFSLEEGPLYDLWSDVGNTYVIKTDENMKTSIDWLNYQGILVNSVEAAGIVHGFMQEPFKNIPLIWTIHEQNLAAQLRQHYSSGEIETVDNWRKVFSRATVIVFPNVFMLMTYSACDTGNYYIIPGSVAEPWEAAKFLALHNGDPRLNTEFGPDDLVVAVVGSQFLYKGLWLEQALVLQALHPLFLDFSSDIHSNSTLKIIVLAGLSTSNYSQVVETIALNLRYPNGTVKHVAADYDTNYVLNIADLVIYGSFLEEQSFPSILLKAMCFGKPIVAPDLSIIKKYVDNGVNGYLFPKKNIKVLTQTMFQLVSNRKLSFLAFNAASKGKDTAKNLMVSDSVDGYVSLLENIIALPSEVAPTRPAESIPTVLKQEWRWDVVEEDADGYSWDKTLKKHNFLDKVEKELSNTHNESSTAAADDALLYSIWEDQKSIDIANIRKTRENEQLKDRTDQTQGTWDTIYRNARRAGRTMNEWHVKDEGELERTGQPLSIYEPYFGEGTWPFLHQRSLYRGLGLSTEGRRPEADDVDAPSRLPLLSNSYYRDVLGEHGGFFAIANRVDHIHKNAWIGFQSWRVTAKNESLTKNAERAILDAIETQKHGDSLYFWAGLDTDTRNAMKQDFWSFCDTINAGNCRFTFAGALKKMYGMKHQNLSSLPHMPKNKDTWSVRHCWVLPTRSFLEFVMFSRMFVDALDSQFYDEHHKTGQCYLSMSKDKHCYTRVLELLVNVWAYHSARRMMYVDPQTGSMEEQHRLEIRRGKMWVKWFEFSTLKSMDEDLAEEWDTDRPNRQWLWPLTGEVFWRGISEKEEKQRIRQKERRRQLSRDKIRRMRKRATQKTIGKYIKPPPEEEIRSNSTAMGSLRCETVTKIPNLGNFSIF